MSNCSFLPREKMLNSVSANGLQFQYIILGFLSNLLLVQYNLNEFTIVEYKIIFETSSASSFVPEMSSRILEKKTAPVCIGPMISSVDCSFIFFLVPLKFRTELMIVLKMPHAGITPAEKLLALYHGKWGQSVDPVFEELLY